MNYTILGKNKEVVFKDKGNFHCISMNFLNFGKNGK